MFRLLSGGISFQNLSKNNDFFFSLLFHFFFVHALSYRLYFFIATKQHYSLISIDFTSPYRNETEPAIRIYVQLNVMEIMVYFSHSRLALTRKGKVFVTYEADSEDHLKEVIKFVALLRSNGFDTHVRGIIFWSVLLWKHPEGIHYFHRYVCRLMFLNSSSTASVRLTAWNDTSMR